MQRFVKSIQSFETIEERKEYLERIVDLMDRSEMTMCCGGSVFVAIIGIYGLLGLVDEALEIFYGIYGEIDSTCLRSILLACSLANPPRWHDAITILHTSDIVEESDGPGRIDQGALGSAIMACSKANEYEEALTLLRLYGRNTQHGSRGKAANTMSVASLNALIAACGRNGKPDLSLEILSTMERRYGVRPDSRSYRNVAIACNKAQHEELRLLKNEKATTPPKPSPVYKWWECGLALLRRMREDGVVPDVATYSATISACESAGEWQRALGVLQAMMDDEDRLDDKHSLLNLYCFNAAISACEKGHAWVEALELYERMLEIGGSIQPNVVTLNSLLESLEYAGQKELATSKYIEGRKLNMVNPWRQTKDLNGAYVRAMDLHNFSAAMAKAAVRTYMDGSIIRNKSTQASEDLLIITGKGIHSEKDPVLRQAVVAVLLNEYGVNAVIDESNLGRTRVPAEELARYVAKNRW